MTVTSLHNYQIAHFWYGRRFSIMWQVLKKGVNDFCSVWPQSAGTTSAMETGLGLSDVQLEAADLEAADLEAADLWIPGFDSQEYNHEHWLTTLACTLIESRFVQDEILLILSPMCKTKVSNDSIRFIYTRPSCTSEIICFQWKLRHEEEQHSSICDHFKKVKDANILKHLLI